MAGKKRSRDLTICTIVSKNYLPYARVLAESFLEHNDGEVFVLLVDRVDNYFDPSKEKFTLLEVEELRDIIPEFDSFCFKYTILELNTAVKPYLLEYLLKKHGMKKLIYFDPDIMVTESLDELSGHLDNNSMVLTPHITSPIEDEFKPGEVELLQAGTYNLGFIGLSNTDNSIEHLKWWQKRLFDGCVVAIEKGLFVDQKWMDLVPGLYGDVCILREPGYNIAYWNYHCRDVSFDDGKFTVNEKPVYFFHFSGFNPANIEVVSKHQNRFILKTIEGMRPAFELYRDRVYSHGWEEIKGWPYFFDRFDNGVKIPPFLRRVYLDREFGVVRYDNPFDTGAEKSFFKWLNEPVKKRVPEITRILFIIYSVRPELKSAFRDIFRTDKERFHIWLVSYSKELQLDCEFLAHFSSESERGKSLSPGAVASRLSKASIDMTTNILMPLANRNQKVAEFFVKSKQRLSVAMNVIPKPSHELGPLSDLIFYEGDFGVNFAGYIQAESGTGEAVRANIRALEKTGVPFALNNIVTTSRQGDKRYTDFTLENPYSVNLIHVNADQAPVFYADRGDEYFRQKYNIGFWYWELSDLPEEWQGSFDYYNEIWVASAFCHEAISNASPVPVVKIPPSVVVDDLKELDRKHFGLEEGRFTFFFLFDFLSFFERKNPMAVVKAFKEAFGPDDDVQLVIKCINSESNPELRDSVIKEIEGFFVKLIDDYLDKDALHTLISLSDCYVSLHRSEGFGLPIAEAMYLGKPVIATGYSGNMEFMNAGNSFPVKYELVEIEKDCGPYKKGRVWAEPDTGHAAELMRIVASDKSLAGEIGRNASNYIKEHLNPEVTGRMIQARLERIMSRKRV